MDYKIVDDFVLDYIYSISKGMSQSSSFKDDGQIHCEEGMDCITRSILPPFLRLKMMVICTTIVQYCYDI